MATPGSRKDDAQRSEDYFTKRAEDGAQKTQRLEEHFPVLTPESHKEQAQRLEDYYTKRAQDEAQKAQNLEERFEKCTYTQPTVTATNSFEWDDDDETVNQASSENVPPSIPDDEWMKNQSFLEDYFHRTLLASPCNSDQVTIASSDVSIGIDSLIGSP